VYLFCPEPRKIDRKHVGGEGISRWSADEIHRAKGRHARRRRDAFSPRHRGKPHV